MNCILDFREIDRAQSTIVGGKAANLGALGRIAGIRVPPGFCVTTAAFERVVVPSIMEQLELLAGLASDDAEGIRELSAECRRRIESIAMPADVSDAIAAANARHGAQGAYAVRSSATAEDSPTTSFAGQHDSYLNARALPDGEAKAEETHPTARADVGGRVPRRRLSS